MSATRLSSGQVAAIVNGRLVGREDVQLAGVAPLDVASSGDLSFLAAKSHLGYFHQSAADAVLVTSDFERITPGPATRIVVKNVRLALARAIQALYPEPAVEWGVSPRARVDRGARWRGRIAISDGAVLGQDVCLGSDCVIGRNTIIERGAVIGNACVVGSHAVIGPGVELANRVRIKAGARVGGVGFAFIESESGHVLLRHIGRCVLEDDVEVGANTTIDRGSVGDTVIGAGTKIDNLVQVAHNVRIGRQCIIMAQTGLAGSTVVEDNVLLAGQAGLAGHLTVGKGARVAAQAGVIGDIPAGATVSGYPARPHREVLRQAAALKRLTRITESLERVVEADGST